MIVSGARGGCEHVSSDKLSGCIANKMSLFYKYTSDVIDVETFNQHIESRYTNCFLGFFIQCCTFLLPF